MVSLRSFVQSITITTSKKGIIGHYSLSICQAHACSTWTLSIRPTHCNMRNNIGNVTCRHAEAPMKFLRRTWPHSNKSMPSTVAPMSLWKPSTACLRRTALRISTARRGALHWHRSCRRESFRLSRNPPGAVLLKLTLTARPLHEIDFNSSRTNAILS